MFNTKKDVDKHVRSCLAKLRTDVERNLRGYTIAKLYFKIGDYNSAFQYIAAYLSVKDNSPVSYKLQGQCYEKLNRPDKALEAYQQSIQLDNTQPDLLIDICKLAMSTNIPLNPIKARNWVYLADKLNIQNEAILNVKLKLLNGQGPDDGGGSNTNQIEELLLKEIIGRPLDITLRIQLIEYYLKQNRPSDAFQVAREIELKQIDVFALSLDWYNTVSMMLTKYKTTETNWAYWLMAITTVERQCFLMCQNTSQNIPMSSLTITDCVNVLFEFDQMLQDFAKNYVHLCPELELAAQFISHFRGQFCLHAATLIFKRELCQTDPIMHWNKDAINYALPLLLLAYNCGTVNSKEVWLRNSIDSRHLIQLWMHHGAFRCFQAGRTLLSCVDDNANENDDCSNEMTQTIENICAGHGGCQTNTDLLAQIRQFYSNSDWRKHTFKYLFKSNHLIRQNTSFFINCSVLSETRYDLPTVDDVEKYEEIAQYLYPSHLPIHVYLTMGVTKMSNVKAFNMSATLNFSISNLLDCSAETLNQLDMDSFLYATTLQAKQKLLVKRKCNIINLNDSAGNGCSTIRPTFLPYPILATDLCTEQQYNWWLATWKVYQNICPDEIAEIRATLQYGIEVVRALLNSGPKMDLLTALSLGRIFQERVIDVTKSVERGFLETRIETLYKYSLHFIKTRANYNNTSGIETRFFQYPTTSTTSTELKTNQMAEIAVTFLAEKYFKTHQYEECIAQLAGVQLPFALYFQAEAYRKLNESNKTRKKRIYIEKAIDCLNQTMNLLKYQTIDKNHPLKSIVHIDIERLQQLNDDNSNDSMNDNGSFPFTDELLHPLDKSTKSQHDRCDSRSARTKKDGEMESIMHHIIDIVSLVNDKMQDVKTEIKGIQTKLQNIEEQVNRKLENTSNTLDPNGTGELEDFFMIDDELQNPGFTSPIYPTATTAYASNVTNQRMQQNHMMTSLMSGVGQQQLPQQHQTMLNPYGSSFYNGLHQMGLNPYPAALMNQLPVGLIGATAAVAQQQQLLSQRTPGMQLPYVDATNLTYGMLQTHNCAPSDPRNSVLGLLTQQPNTTANLSQYQQPQQPQIQSTIPSQISITAQSSAINQPQHQSNNPLMDKKEQNSNILKSWNSAFNNAPVEKSLPVNVVITNSDPLPIHSMVSTVQPTLSVTIPSHHIKNTTLAPPSNVNTFEATSLQLGAISDITSISNTSNTSSAVAGGTTNLGEIKLKSTITADEALDKDVPKKDHENAAPLKSIFDIHFSSTPKNTSFTESVPDTRKSDDRKTSKLPNPFANFLFGSTGGTTINNQPIVISADKPLSNIFGSITATNSTNLFGGVGISTETTASNSQSKNDASVGGTGDAKNDVYGSTLPSLSTTNISSREDLVDDYVPTAHFEPVIALPNLIEVKTGEENEIIKFEHRAKLLRYDKTLKEWKERGLGIIKVLVQKDDPNRARLLMRREQVLKLCCNQILSKDTKFTCLPKVESALAWYGQDYSENELQVEMLAVRFKTPEICRRFHNAILDVQKNMSDDMVTIDETAKLDKGTIPVFGGNGFCNQFEPKEKTYKNEDKKYTSGDGKNMQGFGDKFKPKPGSWNCQMCFISNTVDVLYCLACDTPKDDTVPKKEWRMVSRSNEFTPQTKQTFSFGVSQSPTMTSSATSLQSNNKYKVDKPKIAPIALHSFSINTKEGANDIDFVLKPPVNSSLKTNSSNNNTSQMTTTVSNLGAIPESTTAKFEPKESFSFIFKPKLQTKSKSPIKKTPEKSITQPTTMATDNIKVAEDISDDDHVEEEENNTYFTPVIPLPDKIDVKTGEENETVLYSHRCKLFRFTHPEWKERGLGDVKILRHNITKKLRVVMRRDQVLKICLNHMLTDDIEYKLKDEKTWLFFAIDFSEGEIQPLKFCLRFKNKEIARDFHVAVNNALIEYTNTESAIVADEITTSKSKSKVTDEMVKKAEQLKLPIQFFIDALTNIHCPGCRGCDPDEFKFSFSHNTTVELDKPLPLTMPIKMVNVSSPCNIIKKSAFTNMSFDNKPVAKAGNIFDTKTKFSFEETFASLTTTKTSSTTTNIFSGSPATIPTTNWADGGNFFGNRQTFTVVSSNPSSSSISDSSTEFTVGSDKSSDTLTSSTSISLLSSLPSFTRLPAIASVDGDKEEAKPKDESIFMSTFGNISTGQTKAEKNTLLNNNSLTNNRPTNDDSNPIAIENIFKTDPNLTFASLAENSCTFLPSGNNKSNNSALTGQQFYRLATGIDFGRFRHPEPENGNTSKTDGNDSCNVDNATATSNAENSNYDPHYDPIIALPNEIIVCTGEEDEEKLFGERAKIFRFDAENKEWKERGVGELKLLYHPVMGKYRLLLRREQVYKCVVNQAITSNLLINPMKSSDAAFCWATNNYADESNGAVEKLSARFKNIDIAQKFYQTVKQCIEQLKSRTEIEPEED